MVQGIEELRPAYGIDRTTQGTHKQRRLNYKQGMTAWNGNLRWRGKAYTGLNDEPSKPWIVFPLMSATAPYEANGPAPETDNANMWIEKASLIGTAPTIPER
jgi:hypothetical protein